MQLVLLAFCGSFPQRCHPVNVQGSDPRREAASSRRTGRANPFPRLFFLLDKLMRGNRGLGPCTKQSPERTNEVGGGYRRGQGG